MTQWEKYIEYLKKWAEEHKAEKNAGMSPASFDEWEENEDVADNRKRKIICKITWRVQDIIQAFSDEYDRKPSPTEIDAICNCYEERECEESSISHGWRYIYDAIEEARSK